LDDEECFLDLLLAELEVVPVVPVEASARVAVDKTMLHTKQAAHTRDAFRIITVKLIRIFENALAKKPSQMLAL
jgi:tRNA nucleotidyltransferase (CCA-adding enzyme)